jgi:hypothetical protein
MELVDGDAKLCFHISDMVWRKKMDLDRVAVTIKTTIPMACAEQGQQDPLRDPVF